MDKMREEFSVHCQLWRYPEDIDENGFFINQATQRAWNAWQSAWCESRKALVVKIPDVIEVWSEEEKRYERAYIKRSVDDALDAAGVSYK